MFTVFMFTVCLSGSDTARLPELALVFSKLHLVEVLPNIATTQLKLEELQLMNFLSKGSWKYNNQLWQPCTVAVCLTPPRPRGFGHACSFVWPLFGQWWLVTFGQGVPRHLRSPGFAFIRVKIYTIMPFSHIFSLIFAHSRENEQKYVRKGRNCIYFRTFARKLTKICEKMA